MYPKLSKLYSFQFVCAIYIYMYMIYTQYIDRGGGEGWTIVLYLFCFQFIDFIAQRSRQTNFFH